MVRHIDSPTCIVHADMTLTQSKVKVMWLLKFWKLHILGLSTPQFWGGAQNWWLVIIAWDLVY